MRRAPLLVVAWTSAALLAGASARADDKSSCVAASEKAQQLRNAGKLTEAREQLAVCGRMECPRLVQQDCAQWMAEVLSALPSVIPAAKDRKGRDVVDVRVTVDGKALTEVLDGKAYAVDPGVHTFRFETKVAPAHEEQVVVRQAEKNRVVLVTLPIGDDAGAGGARAPGDAQGAGPLLGEQAAAPKPPIAGFVLAGAGLVGGGIALYLGLAADADGRDLRNSCAPRCSQSQVDDVKARQQRAAILGIAAGVVFATGVALVVIHYVGASSKSGKASPALVPTRALALPSSGDGDGDGASTILRF